ncbi:hypothetical protein [Streptomyces stelliscabiei]|uniref:hypothetical protein n=1 Tax=Streptomyces stelliscabiei TaxID=146820 RepID=UPI0029A1EFE2|nr:hypothetical protein [Streptomyces stelliscabiei]MDX2550189.1 hypothetical protein [Streptomyces stelliscabiei]
MSARDELIEIVTSHPESSGGDAVWATDLVDAYRTEVLAKAIGRMRAIPVDCTALTGPVWYGDGWNSAIRVLEEIAEYQTPDDEAYPGELQRLRAIVLALRVAALRKEDLTEAQRVLNDHEDWRKKATAAAATATPDEKFFVPGRVYTRTNRLGLHLRFVCEHLTSDPKVGDREAWGWLHRSDGTRRMERVWDHDYPNWTPEAGEGRG